MMKSRKIVQIHLFQRMILMRMMMEWIDLMEKKTKNKK